MRESTPPLISDQDERRRLQRIRDLAKELGFEGTVEYRHVWSGTGGAQYRMGSIQEQDLLVVFAEGFERDANPEDFSLEAILAHERGHQLLVRHPKLRAIVAKGISLDSTSFGASIMMGPKKLSEIKKELRKVLGKNSEDLKALLDRETAERKSKNAKDPKILEDLLWVRKILSEAVEEKKARARKLKKPKTKKAPAAQGKR